MRKRLFWFSPDEPGTEVILEAVSIAYDAVERQWLYVTDHDDELRAGYVNAAIAELEACCVI